MLICEERERDIEKAFYKEEKFIILNDSYFLHRNTQNCCFENFCILLIGAYNLWALLI